MEQLRRELRRRHWEFTFFWPIWGRFICCASFAALRMFLGGIIYGLELGAMLVNHRSEVFARADSRPASARSIFRLVLGRNGKYVSRFFLRRSSWLRSPRSMPYCFAAVCWCLLCARQVDRNVQCWLCAPPIKEVHAWQKCDFLGRAGLW